MSSKLGSTKRGRWKANLCVCRKSCCMAQSNRISEDTCRNAVPLVATGDAGPLADRAKQRLVIKPHICGLTDVRDQTLALELLHNVIVIGDGDHDMKCPAVMSFQGKSCASLKTNDNGACAVNAVFGSPGVHQELFHPQARKLVGELLGTSLSELKAKLGENNEFLRAVVTSLWNEFAEPCFAELAIQMETFVQAKKQGCSCKSCYIGSQSMEMPKHKPESASTWSQSISKHNLP